MLNNEYFHGFRKNQLLVSCCQNQTIETKKSGSNCFSDFEYETKKSKVIFLSHTLFVYLKIKPSTGIIFKGWFFYKKMISLGKKYYNKEKNKNVNVIISRL